MAMLYYLHCRKSAKYIGFALTFPVCCTAEHLESLADVVAGAGDNCEHNSKPHSALLSTKRPSYVTSLPAPHMLFACVHMH